MNRPIRKRGEPLIVLAGILVAWIGLRAALWEPPYTPGMPGLVALRQIARHNFVRAVALPPALVAPEAPSLRPWHVESLVPRAPVEGDLTAPAQPGASRPMVAAAHQLMWMAAMSELPSPQSLLDSSAGQDVLVLGSTRLRLPSQRRWTGDGWLLWRSGSGTSVGGLAPSTYGGSQGGMVLRYRLAPSSPYRPTLYLRGTAAMDGSGETDSAFGFSVRPIARFPVIAAVEARMSRFADGSVHVRPAAMVVTELVPQPLPFAMRAEIYGAAGYVGGAAATAFVDGQLRVDHHVATMGPTELRAGAGVWGGAQQGAGRLDVGPTATLGVSGGHFGARLGVDWRFRVAGDSAPTSGPAVTLSGGF